MLRSAFRRLVRDHRGIARPVVLFLALAAIPVGIWSMIESREDTALIDLTRHYTDGIVIQIQAATEVRMGAFRGMSDRIATEAKFGEQEFEEAARDRMKELPGLVGLTWVDSTHILRWAYPRTPGMTAMIGKDASKFPSGPYALKAVATRAPAASPPLDLMAGGRGFVSIFPGYWNQQRIGSLGAIISVPELMRVALGGNASPNFALAVVDGDRVLFTSGSMSLESPYLATGSIQVLDRTWTVRAIPTAAYVARQKTSSKLLLLVLGLMLSAAVAMMYHAALEGRRRAEENQRRFQDIAEIGTDWLWELDADLRYTYVSPRIGELFGLEPAALIGKPRADLVWTAENPPEVLEAYRRTMHARQPFRNFKFRLTGIGGRTIDVMVSGVPIYDGAGRFAGYRGTGTDLTAELAAKRASEQAEQRLRSAMESLPGGFLFYDADSRLVMWNSYLSQFYPLAYPQLKAGMTYAEVVNLVAPLHFVGTPAEIGKQSERWIGDFKAQRMGEEEIELKDGRIIRAIDWRTPDGSTVCLRFDVTEAKEREEQLRRAKSLLYDAIEAVPAAFMLWDKSDRLIMWNSTVEQVNTTLQGRLTVGLHFEEFLDIVSVNWADCATEQERREATVRRIADFRNAPSRSEVRLKDGRVVQVIDWRSFNQATVSLSFDITDARRREEALRQAQKLEAVGQLTGGIAHDFNNLLTVIIGYTEFLRSRGQLDGRDSAALNHVLSAALRGSNLIKRLMVFSRTQPMQAVPVQPNQLVHELAPLLERALGETIELVADLDTEAGTVVTDRGQLESVLMNLAINARDAMGQGGTLTIATRRKQGRLVMPAGAESSGVEIRVTDTGEGMSSDVVQRAFDPFFTTKEVGKGTGLGLSMVYSFAQAANGQVSIDSAPGQGTTVALWIPDGGAAAAEAESVVQEEPAPAEFGRGRRVLIVEDDLEVASYANEAMVSLGFRPSTARTSQEAQDLLNNHGPWDLLFTDVVLPGGMSGPELVRWCQKRHPNLPVLFTSGYVREQDKPLQVSPLLRKPYRRAELAREVGKVLDPEAPADASAVPSRAVPPTHRA